jgi:hypothetical protein
MATAKVTWPPRPVEPPGHIGDQIGAGNVPGSVNSFDVGTGDDTLGGW